MEYVGDHWELYDTLNSRQKDRLLKILERKRKEKETAELSLLPDEA